MYESPFNHNVPNGQTHCKNIGGFVVSFLKFVLPFWGVMHCKVKHLLEYDNSFTVHPRTSQTFASGLFKVKRTHLCAIYYKVRD